jgi:four helix bundle protein
VNAAVLSWCEASGEAQAAESRKGFVRKLKICHKELRASRRWLRLIQRVPLLKPAQVQSLVGETEELIRIFAASLRTAKEGKREAAGQGRSVQHVTP